MKSILLNIINNDKSYNKSATRYLNKTDPQLWANIISATQFLPDTALPKQRIWHILNDVWGIPKCPVTGLQVKWFNNRYLKTISPSAKTTLMNITGKLNNRSKEANIKRSNTIKKNYRNGKHIKVEDRNIDTTYKTQKTEQTCLLKYGVTNPAKHPEFSKKISDALIAQGATPKELRSARRLYQDAVIKFTKQNWIAQFNNINPNRLDRSTFHLDHIYSIHQGFKDSIPPYIIGHWTNLRLIPATENCSKGKRCDKTQEQLFEDFFKSIDFAVDRCTI